MAFAIGERKVPETNVPAAKSWENQEDARRYQLMLRASAWICRPLPWPIADTLLARLSKSALRRLLR